MNVCIPIVKDEGLASRISPHFGMAPCFLFVDSETRSFRAMANERAGQRGNGREVADRLLAEHVDAVVVAGIGPGAMSHLERFGARLYGASTRSVADVLEELSKGTLSPLTPDSPLVHGHRTREEVITPRRHRHRHHGARG